MKLPDFTVVSLLSLFLSSAVVSRIRRVFISNLCSSYESQLIFMIVIIETDAIIAQACSLCVLTSADLKRNQFKRCFVSLHTVKCAECLQYISKPCVFPNITS